MVFKSAKDFKEENAAPKPPSMKFRQAAKIADKNARTIVKIQQLLDITQMPAYSTSDPDGHIMIRVDQLKKRLNRRLAKLAKWVDTPAEERQVEFRNYRTYLGPSAHGSTFVKPENPYLTGGSYNPYPRAPATSTAALAQMLREQISSSNAPAVDVVPAKQNSSLTGAMATTSLSAAPAPADAASAEPDITLEIEELSSSDVKQG